MRTKCPQSPRFLKSIVYSVPFVVITSGVVVSSALATSQLSDDLAVETDTNRTIEIVQEVSRSLSSDVTLQSDENREVERITLQNIHSIKDFDIFGSELMTKAEMAKFRKDLQKIETQGQLEQYLANHRTRMNARAAERGVVLD